MRMECVLCFVGTAVCCCMALSWLLRGHAAAHGCERCIIIVSRLALHVNELPRKGHMFVRLSAFSLMAAACGSHWLSFGVSTGQSSFTPPTISCLMPTFLATPHSAVNDAVQLHRSHQHFGRSPREKPHSLLKVASELMSTSSASSSAVPRLNLQSQSCHLPTFLCCSAQ